MISKKKNHLIAKKYSYLILISFMVASSGFFLAVFLGTNHANALTLQNYRWRLDDGNEIDATWGADENTPIYDWGHDEIRRLRFGVSNSNFDSEFLLEQSKMMNSGEDYYMTAVTDESAGFAYFGTYTQSCRIVKVSLADFSVVDTLTLSVGENECVSSVIDSNTGYAYFGLNTAPGKIVKINLLTFEAEETLTLNNGENYLETAVIDVGSSTAYFGTRTEPGVVVKVDLSNFSRVDSTILNSGENNLKTAQIDNDYLYFGTNTDPGRIVRLDLNTFTRDSAIVLSAGESMLYGSAISNAKLYVTTFTTPGMIVGIDLATFSRFGALSLGAGDNNLISMILDESGIANRIFVGTSTAPAKIIQVNLDTFTKVDDLTLEDTEQHLYAGTADSANEMMYFGTYHSVPGRIVKVNMNGLVRVDAIVGSVSGQHRFTAGAVDSNGTFAYYGTDTSPAQVIKVRLSDMSVVGTQTMSAGDNGIMSAVLDEEAGFVYFGTNTSPGKVIKVRMTDLVRVSSIILNAGEDKLMGAVFDDSGANKFIYFTTYTAPMKVVKINLSSFSRVGTLTMATDEDRGYGSAIIDKNNGYAYFGTYTTPGKIIKVNLSDFSKNSTLTLNLGENNLNSADFDELNGMAYFGTQTAPGRLVKVNLTNFEREDAYIFNNGEDYLSHGVIDSANGYGYWSTFWSFPAKIIKIRLADMTRFDDLTLPVGQDRLWSSMFDYKNGYVYFSSYTNPSTLYKISIAPKYELQVEFGLKGDDTCEALANWNVVPANATNNEHFEMKSSRFVTNTSATTNLADGLSDTGAVFHPGYIMTASPITPLLSLGENEFSEVEYSISTTKDTIVQAEYCFRVTNNGEPVDDYVVYAKATDPTNDPTINNTVTLSRSKTGAVSTFRLDFTLQNTLSSQLTVTFPSGFTVLSAATGGSNCFSNFSFTSNTLSADKNACSAAVYIEGATIQNPAQPGEYIISWVNDDPGDASVYIVDDDQISVTSVVLPSLSFNVGTTVSCDHNFSGSGGSIDFGTLTTDSVASSDVGGIEHICLRMSANSAGGTTAYVRSVYGALQSATNSSDKINSETATLTGGTAGYGICIGTDTGHTGTNPAHSGSDEPTLVSPFNSVCNSSTHNVGGLSGINQTIWTIDNITKDAFTRIFVKVAISPITPARSDYMDTLIFGVTSTY